MTKNVDTYFAEGCGRCSLGGTPDGKVHKWAKELALLRKIMLDCGLTEESKWGVPCYTFRGSNIALVGAFKQNCVITFFKGTLLQDTDNILSQPGENSQAAKMARFTNVQQIIDLQTTLKAYIYEAIEVEKAGLKVTFKKTSEYVVVEEFQTKLDQMPALKTAFEALTPGRQRGYLLHFAEAKQAKTREARVEKQIPQILQGKGFNEYR